jgi:hypothetical protein
VDDFEALAAATFVRAGIEVSPDELGLIHLIHDAVFSSAASLEAADPARFPFEPVDPSQPPPPR